MAEQQQQVEDQQVEEQNVDDQFAQADAQADPNEPAEPPSLEEIASRMGWVPQDRFKGPQDKWKPADQFILDGNDIKDRHARELKEMRTTLETVSRTSGAILAENLQRQHDALANRYAAAVEKGDPDEAWKAAQEIRDLQTTANPAPQRVNPAPETVSWVERNTKVRNDPVAWDRALAICDAYAKQFPNSTPAEQLAYTESNMKREYPHLFDGPGKAPPGVNEPGSRVGTPAKRGKTTADLPKAAKDVAQDLVDRGLIKSIDDYARNYFAQAEKA